MKIPVQIPPDHFAMAFYYDEVTKKLEGIPLVAVDSKSITIATRHFSKLTVSAIANSALDALVKADINSSFKPGIDDWQFENWGSYIAPGGHCAGQASAHYGISAYSRMAPEQPSTDATITIARNLRPLLWQKMIPSATASLPPSMKILTGAFENKFWADLAGVNDSLTFKAFAYAMQLTGEPQEIGIYSNAGGGHDMIAYRIFNNNLYIADPNYPGNLDRRIEFVNNAFKAI